MDEFFAVLLGALAVFLTIAGFVSAIVLPPMLFWWLFFGGAA